MTKHLRVFDTNPEPRPVPRTSRAHAVKPVERLFRAGQKLFHQGDAARHVFELRSGVLRQSCSLENGERQVIGFHFKSEIIGFSPDGIHRTSCTAITNCRAVIHRVDAQAASGRDPEMDQRFRAAAIRGIATAQDNLVMLGRKTARAKVESFVQYMVERAGVERDGSISVDVPMNRYDIADFLGIAVETVSRSFTQLRESGVIEMCDAHKLVILRPAELVSIH
jgi:CRP-like cAMP-binding protein